MSKLIDLITALAPKSQRESDEAHAQAADIHDPEPNKRETQGGTRPGAFGLVLLYSAYSAR